MFPDFNGDGNHDLQDDIYFYTLLDHEKNDCHTTQSTSSYTNNATVQPKTNQKPEYKSNLRGLRIFICVLFLIFIGFALVIRQVVPAVVLFGLGLFLISISGTDS